MAPYMNCSKISISSGPKLQRLKELLLFGGGFNQAKAEISGKLSIVNLLIWNLNESTVNRNSLRAAVRGDYQQQMKMYACINENSCIVSE